MQKKIKQLWKYPAVFLAVLAVLWLCLVLAAGIPNGAIETNMEKSALSYAQTDAFTFTDGQKLCSVSDNYADSILLGVSWNMGEGNPFVSSINTRYHDGGTYGENYGLYTMVKEGAEPNTDYTRYWHGTAMFIRLLHVFTDVRGTKTIGFVAICVLILLTCTVLAKRKQYGIAAAFLLSLCLVQFWNLRLSLEYQPAFLVALALCPIFLRAERKGDSMLPLLSVISGTAVAFFDFLTTETVSVLLPLLLVIAVRAKENRLGTFRQTLPLLIKCGAAWLFSYGGSFLAKWTAASFVTGQNAFSAAFSSAAERVSGAVQTGIEQPSNLFSSVLANLAMPLGNAVRTASVSALAGTAVLLLAVLSIWYLFRRGAEKKPGAAGCLFLLGGAVFVRFFALYNHSFVHAFFTYRALVCPIFSLFSAALLHMKFPEKAVKSKQRKKS